MNQPTDGLPDGPWVLQDQPRVRPLDADKLSRPARLVLAVIRRRTRSSEDFNVFRTFARLGGIFPVHALLVGKLLQDAALKAAEKELVILRVAWRTGCAYEWFHHSHMARECGASVKQVRAIASEETSAHSTRLQAMLAVVDELVADRAVSTATWSTAAALLTEEELLELCFLVGHYVMVATTINATGIQVEAEFLPGGQHNAVELP